MKNKIFRKTVALILSLAMTLTLLSGTILAVSAAADEPTPYASSTESAYSSATSKETVYLDGVYYNIEKSLFYDGNSTYRLDIQLKSSVEKSETPYRRTSAENGYFTVDTAGYYLIELWGGAGSVGGNAEYLDGTIVYAGGNGGYGGYVYAKVYLEAGQTLAYSIGTNGTQTLREDSGGGANAGGEHGEVGSYAIGAGGGYSALYFFNDGEFNPDWLKGYGWEIPDSVRISKYVMIAAGGGGGGAGNGLLSPNTYNGYEYYADGGNGGSVSNGVTMQLQGESYAVPGYIFAGQNGSSSGTSTAYVGKGGSNVPGKIPQTSGGLYKAEPGPNDWIGTYNMEAVPGAGGISNMRGGGGGAGYCGGSGGIMQSLLVADNVGGGGGGSSFISRTIGGSNTVFGSSLDSDTLSLVLGQRKCPSSIGGAFSYTYLGAGASDTVEDTEYLTSISLNGEIAGYFTVTSASSRDNYGNENGVISYSNNTSNANGTFTVSGASIDAAHNKKEGVLLKIQLLLEPKAGFVGGNNVPLLKKIDALITRDGETKTINASANAATDYANVPITLSVKTKSVTESLKEGMPAPTFKLSTLYENEHSTAIRAFKNNSTRTWQYSFLSNLSDYTIYLGKNGAQGDPVTYTETPGITETTYYSIAISATPNTSGGYAKVGPKNSSVATFYGIACIGIVESDVFDEDDGWAYTLTADKNLEYDGTNYIYSTEMGQNVTLNYGTTKPYNSSGTSLTVETAGYYLVQLWGGDGGDGGYARAVAKYSSGTTYSAYGAKGSGGSGGTIYAFVYLNVGDKLSFEIGAAGVDGTSRDVGVGYGGDTGRTHSTAGDLGTGGTASSIKITRNGVTEYLMVAGGGGGGGGGGATATCTGVATESGAGSSSTGSGNTMVLATTLPKTIDKYNGTNGVNGHGSGSGWGWGSAGGGSAGTSGANFGNSKYVNVGKTQAETIYIARMAETLVNEGGSSFTNSAAKGKSAVTFMCSPSDISVLSSFPSIETEGIISNYFEVVNKTDYQAVSMKVKGLKYYSTSYGSVTNGKAVTWADSKGVAQGKYTWTLVENADGTTSYKVSDTLYYPSFYLGDGGNTMIAHCGFTIVIKLKPKTGFMGGNDVPLIMPDGDKSSVKVKQGELQGSLSQNDAVDYANVAITYDIAKDFSVNDKVLILGDGDTSNDSVTVDELYNLTTDLTPASPDEAWKSSFVCVEKPTGTVYSPDKTETVAVTVAISPITKVPQRALVTGATVGVTETLSAVIYVKYHVTYNMTNMTYIGESAALYDTDFNVGLSANEGYLQPPGEISYISVKVGGETISDFTYNEATGELKINASAVTAPIEIIAVAKEMEYTIHYVYQLEDGGPTEEYTESYVTGDTVDYTWLNSFTAPERNGYEFLWQWDIEGGVAPETMPARNIWVIGSYTKRSYTLTINYLDSAGESVAEAYVGKVKYEESYTVSSPKAEGFMPSSATSGGVSLSNPFVISGTMGDGDVTVNVTYLAMNNTVVVIYLSRKTGEELAPRYTSTVAENESFSISSPQVVGYTPEPDGTVVSGTMTSGGVYEIVYYTPNTYNIKFEYKYEETEYKASKPAGTESIPYEFQDAYMEGESSSVVEYDNIYSFNAANYTYGLPLPIVLGFDFVGWYLDPECTQPISEDTQVKITEDSTVYAKWEPVKFSITVIYDFVFEEGDFAPDYTAFPESVKYHAEKGYYYSQDMFYMTADYHIPMAEIVGYTAYSDYALSKIPVTELSGKMPATGVMFYITYEINTYTVVFADLAGQYLNSSDPIETLAVFDTVWQTIQVKHGVIPVYTEAKPTHAYNSASPEEMLRNHSYIYTNWVEEGTGAEYSISAALPAATSDICYYAEYDVFENIAYIVDSSGVTQSYHYTLQRAIDRALLYEKTSEDKAPRVVLRRNGTADTVDLSLTDADIVQVDNNESLIVHIILDLNGYKLTSDKTLFNVVDRFYIYDTVGGEGIVLNTVGDAVAITVVSDGSLYVGKNSDTTPYTVKISVSSEEGDAYIAKSEGTVRLYSADLTSTTESGTAYGVYSNQVYLYGGSTVRAVSTSGDACAIYASGSATFSATGAKLYAESRSGTAYGIKSEYVASSSNTYTTEEENKTVIEAYSAEGDSFAIDANALGRIYANITAKAPNGTATAINLTGKSNTSYIGESEYAYSVVAEGKNAYGIKSPYYVILYCDVMATGTERAVGMEMLSSAYYFELINGSRVVASTDSGTAIALLNSKIYIARSSTAASVLATSNSGDAYALYNTYAYNTVTSAVVFRAESTSGNAYGYYSNDLNERTMPSTAAVSAYSPNGNAYGAYIANNNPIDFGVSAEGKNAYGLYVAVGATAPVNSTAVITASNTLDDGIAYGIYNDGILSVANGASISVDALSEAYGIYNGGIMDTLGASVTVTADGEAYGVYNDGLLSASGVIGANISATSQTANSYALYTRSGIVGSNSLDDAVENAVLSASVGSEGAVGYAIYAASGAEIYIKGPDLYYKGSADEYARYGDGITILKGYIEEKLPETDATYPEYFYLKAVKYTLIFVHTGPKGDNGEVEIFNANYAEFEYTLDTVSIAAPAHPANDIDSGYTVDWESYDFTAPDGDGVYVKYVYSEWTPRQIYVRFYIGGNNSYQDGFYDYKSPLQLPDMSTMTYYGYNFTGEWYTDSSYTALNTYTTVPSTALYLYAKWTPGTYTVRFVTNCDVSIPDITAQYNSYQSFSADLVKPGYSFEGWYRDPDLENYYTSNTSYIYMPGEDMTLYARWEVSMSLVVLGSPTKYTINLNIALDTNGDGTEDFVQVVEQWELSGDYLHPVMLTPSNMEVMSDMSIGTELYFRSSITADLFGTGQVTTYFLRGWEDADGNPVNLTSGVGSWGIKPVNGEINIYAVIEERPWISQSADMLIDFIDMSIFGSDAMEIDGHTFHFFGGALAEGGTYTAETGSLGISCRALLDGMHKIYLLPLTGNIRNILCRVTIIKPNGEDIVEYYDTVESVMASDSSSLTYENIFSLDVELKKGEVVLIELVDDDPDGVMENPDDAAVILYSMVDSPVQLDKIDSEVALYELIFEFMTYNVIDLNIFTVESEPIVLPTDPEPGYEGVIGWAYKTNGSYSAPIENNTVDTSFFGISDAWTDLDGISALTLYPIMEGGGSNMIWMGYIVADRYFSPEVFDSELTAVNIKKYGAVSFAFGTESMFNPGDVLTLKFENGLPAGTTLTLIEYGTGESYPRFYSYIVPPEQDGIKEIPLTLFRAAGKDSTFGGQSAIVMFNISYRNASFDLTSETVSLAVGSADTGVSLTYNFIDRRYETIPGDMTLTHTETLEGNVPIPSLKNRGYGDNDRAVLVIRMSDADGNPVAFPASMELQAVGGVIYSFGDFAIADLGYVRYFTSSQSVKGFIHLDSLKYNGISEYNFIYQIVVIPEYVELTTANIYGTNVFLDTEYRLRVIINEDDTVELLDANSSRQSSITAGERLTLNAIVGDGSSSEEIELYVYQASGGTMVYTDSCATLLEGFTTDTEGKTTPVSTATLYSGTLELQVSANAASGVYYLVVCRGESYAVYALTVTEAAQA